jgi:hypothetical protein
MTWYEKIPEDYIACVEEYCRGIEEIFGGDLFSIALFGSVARGKRGKDVDILIVSDGLDPVICRRFRRTLNLDLRVLKTFGRKVYEHILTPEEVRDHPPILLDLTQDAIILFDRDDFLSEELEIIRAKLKELDAKRIWLDEDRWYWDLKPDSKIGETIEI